MLLVRAEKGEAAYDGQGNVVVSLDKDLNVEASGRIDIQADGRVHPEAHFHVEFYPAYRMPGRLKYLAGSELGAGVFTADTLPEEKAAELRAVEVQEYR